MPRTDPDGALIVFKQCGDRAGRQCAGAQRIWSVSVHHATLAVENIDAIAIRAEPDRAVGTIQSTQHTGIAQRVRPCRAVVQRMKGVGNRIVALQPTAPAANPKQAGAVTQQAGHRIHGKTTGHRGITYDAAHDALAVGVEHVDPAAISGNPDLAGQRFGDVGHPRVGEAVAFHT